MFGLVADNPKSYPSVAITDVCDFQGGSQPPKKDWIKEPQEGYVRMLQIRDFTQSEKDNIEYVKETNSLKMCEDDDVLIGRYGASVGKILTGLSGAYNVAIMKSIPDLTVLNKTYLRYYFLSDEFQKYILASSTSRAAQAGFSKEDLKRMNVLLAPIALQEQFETFVIQNDKSKFMDMTSDEYIIELAIQCENDFERFRGRNIERILKVDISDLRIMAFHVVGALEGCKEIKSTGLMNLQMVLSKNTYLIRLLCKVGIKFDISEKTIDCDRKIYSIDYEKDRHSHFSSGIADKLSSVAHRVYYDYCVNVFS